MPDAAASDYRQAPMTSRSIVGFITANMSGPTVHVVAWSDERVIDHAPPRSRRPRSGISNKLFAGILS